MIPISEYHLSSTGNLAFIGQIGVAGKLLLLKSIFEFFMLNLYSNGQRVSENFILNMFNFARVKGSPQATYEISLLIGSMATWNGY